MILVMLTILLMITDLHKPHTLKQKKFFKEVLTAPSFAEAARTAGYSKKSARYSAYKNITKYNDFFINLFQEADIDIDTLALNLKEGLHSPDENVRYRYVKLTLGLIEKVLKTEDQSVVRLPRLEEDEYLREEEDRIFEALAKEHNKK